MIHLRIRNLILLRFSSVTYSCLTLCDPMDYSTPGFPVHHQLPKFTQNHVHRVGDAIQPSHPLLSLLLLPSVFPSIRVFSNKSVLCIRWPKYWSFSFIHIPMNIQDWFPLSLTWFDLLTFQGTLKSLLQHDNSKASILWHSAFFTTLASIHNYWKNHNLD